MNTILPPGHGAVLSAERGPPTAAELANPQTAKTWKTAQEFESMALGAFLAPIFDTIDNAKSPFGGGDGEKAWRPMLTQEMAKHLSGSGGLGLAAPVFRQMLQMQETAQNERNGTDK